MRRALKHQFRAILVDEFQDTDPVQYELVLFLAEAEDRDAPRWQEVCLEPGKLFVVGDPKQSIYAFRRADMEAYDRVIDGVVLADGAFGESLVLQTNFRSHADLLAPVNACFSRLFPAEALKGLQPKNEPLVPVMPAAAANPHEGLLVRLVRPREPEADAETATRCEAESLAHWLSEEVFGRRQLQEGDVSVTVKPRHVGILLRTLTVAREYVEALRRHHIPYVTEGEKHFFERQEVIDLGNLLCACLTPHDQIALAAVLRSALGGLTDRELEQLVSAGRLDFRRDPPTGLPSAERLYRLLRDLHHTLPRLPVVEGLEYLFDRVPVLELAAAWQDGEQAVANVKKLRALLIQTGEPPGASWRTVVRRLRGWFLDRPDEAESPLAEEGTEALDQEGAVRVLSIHKAKGLEFPMVILAGLHRGTDRREDRITVHQDWSTGLVGVQVGAWRTVGGVYLGAKLSERQRAEERRVLYVAMTRAKRRLVLSAGLPTTRSSRGEGGLSLVSEGWGMDLQECRPGPIQVGGVSVPVEVETAGGDISKLVGSFPGLHVESVDGTDFLSSLRAMRSAAAYVRARKGPALVHAHVIRPYSHSQTDDERLYKTPAEREAEELRDPILRFSEFLRSGGLATSADLAAITADVDREIGEAALEALKAPRPLKSTAGDWVFSPTVDPCSPAFDHAAEPEGEPETMVTAINRTLKDEMARDARIVVFGEDIADASRKEALAQVSGKGGVFKVTHGLQRLYGDQRVFNTPIAEASIIGRAVGMATRGLKPVVEIQFFDYIWPAMMQLRNEMSMLRYRSANHFSCPMVIRVPIGGYLRGGGPYHSQSGESIFAHCPGIRVVFPSNATDAAGLLRTAIRCDDPVLFLEHKHLYRQTYNKGAYPGRDFMLPFAAAQLVREGNDVLVVTWGALVQRSLLAAQQAEKEGVRTAVLDLRTLVPCDWAAIASHLKRINRIVIAHEDQLTCGFGAEIAARVASEHFGDLDAPVVRVAALDTPVAYSPDLEEAILPQPSDILAAILKTAKY